MAASSTLSVATLGAVLRRPAYNDAQRRPRLPTKVRSVFDRKDVFDAMLGELDDGYRTGPFGLVRLSRESVPTSQTPTTA